MEESRRGKLRLRRPTPPTVGLSDNSTIDEDGPGDRGHEQSAAARTAEVAQAIAADDSDLETEERHCADQSGAETIRESVPRSATRGRPPSRMS